MQCSSSERQETHAGAFGSGIRHCEITVSLSLDQGTRKMLALIFLARQFRHASDARGPLRPLPRAELALALDSILEDIVFSPSSLLTYFTLRTWQLKCGDEALVVAF